MADINALSFFARPIGSRPDPTLRSETGAPMYRDAGGNAFSVMAQAPQNRLALMAAAMAGERYDPALEYISSNRAQGGPGNALAALLSGALGGASAPGRALAGEPVTYGDAWATALDFGAGGAGMAAPDGALRANGIRAYHGSPHSFDKFSMDKIGTGEGAQAYGHGLYFAENEGVARSYRDALSAHMVNGRPVDYSASDDLASSWFTAMGDRGKAADYLQRQIDNPPKSLPNFRPPEEIETMRRAIETLRSDAPLGKTVPSGSMYEVNINADPADFLDWDVPLSAQPERAKIALRGFLDRTYGDGFFDEFAEAGNDINNIHKNFDDTTPQQLTDALAGRGIPGIKYLDAGSRRATDVNELRGTVSMWERAAVKTPNDEYAAKMLADSKNQLAEAERSLSKNFVVFDENLINIVRKYGVAGAATMLGMTAAEVEAAMAGQQ